MRHPKKRSLITKDSEAIPKGVPGFETSGVRTISCGADHTALGEACVPTMFSMSWPSDCSSGTAAAQMGFRKNHCQPGHLVVILHPMRVAES